MRDLPEYAYPQEMTMAAHNHATKLAELDRLLNDPSVPDDPDRVWTLVAEIARYERAMSQITLSSVMLSSKDPGSVACTPNEFGVILPKDAMFR